MHTEPVVTVPVVSRTGGKLCTYVVSNQTSETSASSVLHYG